jgi:hypothetical protein
MATIPTMSKEIETALLKLFSELALYAEKTSNIYTKQVQTLSSNFQRLHSMPERLITTAQIEISETNNLLYHILYLGKPQAAFARDFENINSNFNRILKNFAQYKANYAEISNRILDRLNSIEQIHKMIIKMQNIAKEIKIFSINSVIIASQAGKKGVGFKSISRFIIELSDIIQKSALQLELYRDKILHIQNLLKEQFDTLLNVIYGKKIEEIQKETQNSVIWAGEDMQYVLNMLVELQKRITGTLDSGQQIAKPFLETGSTAKRLPTLLYTINALNAMKDVKDSVLSISDPREVFHFGSYLYFILNQLSGVFDQTTTSLTTYRDKVIHAYRNYLVQFGASQQDQMYILNYLTNKSAQEESLLDQIFNSLKKNTRNFQHLLKEENEVKEQIIDTFLEIEKIHQEGVSIFSHFEKFFTTMNNINILAQIEISKNQFTNNNNLKSKFFTMLNNLKSFNEDIKTQIYKMLNSILLDISQFSDLQLEQSSFLRNTDAYFDVEIGQLNFSLSLIKRSLNIIKEENPKIFNSEMALRNAVDNAEHISGTFLELFADIRENIVSYSSRFLDFYNYIQIDIEDFYHGNFLIDSFAKMYKETVGDFIKHDVTSTLNTYVKE